MKEFQGKRQVKGILYSTPFVIFLAVVVLVLANSVWGVWRRSRVVNDDRDRMLAQLAELEVRKARLERDISLLETDRGVEQAIRQKFSVVKEGEGVITVVLPEVATGTPTSSSWWGRLLHLN